jgi:2-dehydro-3-deoxygalactonokinase
MTAAFIGIDWGTTHRRAVLLSRAGDVLAEHADAEGGIACAGRFRPALEDLLARWPAAPADTPVVMAGMVGSAMGWQAVPYLEAATPLEALAQALVPVADAPAGRRWFIVPGYCIRGAAPAAGSPVDSNADNDIDADIDVDVDVDVMRGEETQLYGAMRLLDADASGRAHPSDGCYVLPGTHSKWVRLVAGRVVALRTCMTGELFAQIRERGTLASAMQGAPRHIAADDPAFVRGVRAMLATRPPLLSHALFGARARVVTGALAGTAAAAYVSGLLIGAEWADARQRPGCDEPVRLIGEPALAALHAACAAQFGQRVQVMDARDVQLAAWRALATDGIWT